MRRQRLYALLRRQSRSAQKHGMEAEEVYRLKQITGIAELFKHQVYSRAWEMAEVDGDEETEVLRNDHAR